MIRKEVIIVGGGPAGSSCAGRLRKVGVDCLILDKQTFPRFKTCAGWITPRVLTDLQLDPVDYPYSFTTFRSFRISVSGIKFTIPTRQFAIRRIEFDDWLLKRSGASINYHQVKDISLVDNGYLIDGEFQAIYLVGAGGTYCPVRNVLFKAPIVRQAKDQIVAMEEEFQYPVSENQCQLWFLENGLPGYSWYVPKSGGYVNVGVGGKVYDLKRKNDTIQRHWGLVVSHLEEVGLIKGHDYQPAAHTYYVRNSDQKVHSGNAYLVGDSAGLATRDMGEGIGAAIKSGLLAAESIITGKEYNPHSIPKYSFWSILSGRMTPK